jgi:hypothetical protein
MYDGRSRKPVNRVGNQTSLQHPFIMKNIKLFALFLLQILATFQLAAQNGIEYNGVLHTAYGNAQLNLNGNNLDINNLMGPGDYVDIALGGSSCADFCNEPFAMNPGSSFQLSSVSQPGGQEISGMRLRDAGNGNKIFEVGSNFPFSQIHLKAYLNGNIVYDQICQPNLNGNSTDRFPWLPVALYVLDNISGHYTSGTTTTTTTTHPDGTKTTTTTTTSGSWGCDWGGSIVAPGGGGGNNGGGQNEEECSPGYPAANIQILCDGSTITADYLVAELEQAPGAPPVPNGNTLRMSGNGLPNVTLTNEHFCGPNQAMVQQPGVTVSNSPNPFAEQTVINYELPSDDVISLVVYDMRGNVVQTLVNNVLQAKGKHQETMDADQLQNGLYYYTLYTGKKAVTQKMVCIR